MTHPQTPFDGLSILPWILSTAFAVSLRQNRYQSQYVSWIQEWIMRSWRRMWQKPQRCHMFYFVWKQTSSIGGSLIDLVMESSQHWLPKIHVGSLSCFWIPHEHLTWRQLCWFCWLVAFFNKCQQYHGSWSFLNGPDAKRFSRYQLRSDDLMDICTVKVPRSDGYSSLQKYPKHFKGHDLKL